MRLIHQSDYTLEERLMYKPIVYANAIQSMSIILNAVEKLSMAHNQK
jgi:guanine nucleotide-binding protein G(i) subunit alpha